MKVAKWGNSLAVRIPKDVADALGLKEGSDVDLVPLQSSLGVSPLMTKEEALKAIERLARPLPKGWKLNRDELYGLE